MPFVYVNNFCSFENWMSANDDETIQRIDPLISFPGNPDEWPAFRVKLHA
jgi:hypothetical protein